MPRGRPKRKIVEHRPVKLDTVNPVEIARTDNLVKLLTCYANYTPVEARRLLTSIVSMNPDSLESDVIAWCVHLKEVKDAQELIYKASQGDILIQRTPYGWQVLADDSSVSEASI